MHAQQQIELERVASKIATEILAFCRFRLASGLPQFYLDDLRRWVVQRCAISPDSPSRILRQLRAGGRISYVVLNRAESLYRIEAVR